MDILIKNMEKPQYCYGEKDHYIIKPCPFLQTCYKKWGVYINAINVHSDACPLVELPPHGRLIDADALIEQTQNWYCSKENCEDNYNGIRCRACWVDDAIGIIDDAPTILEAST